MSYGHSPGGEQESPAGQEPGSGHHLPTQARPGPQALPAGNRGSRHRRDTVSRDTACSRQDHRHVRIGAWG